MIFKYTRLWLQADPAQTFSVMVPTQYIQEDDLEMIIEGEIGRVVANSLGEAEALLIYAIQQGRYPADSQLAQLIEYQE